MQYINYILLLGNLGGDPEIRVLESGVKMAKFNIATSECYFDKNGIKQIHTQWHSIVCWRNNADYAERHLKIGSLVRIEGRIRTRTIPHDKTETKLSPYEIIATSVQLMTDDTINTNGGLHCNNISNSPKNPQRETTIQLAGIDPDNLPF